MLILIDDMKLIDTQNYTSFGISNTEKFWTVEAIDGCSNKMPIKTTASLNNAKIVLRGIYRFMAKDAKAIEINEIGGDIVISELEQEDSEPEKGLKEKFFETWEDFLCQGDDEDNFLNKLKRVRIIFNIKDNDSSEFGRVINSAIRKKVLDEDERVYVIRKILRNIHDKLEEDLDCPAPDWGNSEDNKNSGKHKESGDFDFFDDDDDYYEDDFEDEEYEEYSGEYPFDFGITNFLKNLGDLGESFMQGGSRETDNKQSAGKKEEKQENKKSCQQEKKPAENNSQPTDDVGKSLEELFSTFKTDRTQSQDITKNVEKTLGAIFGNINEDKNKDDDKDNDN